MAKAELLKPNTNGNLQVINALINAGSDPKKLHPIEYHFYCFEETCIEALKKKGEALGFKLANLGSNKEDGVVYWYGDLIKPEALGLPSINKTNIVMLQIAQDIGAEYDGWGTSVVK
tara:strand:- start:2135 stop:2485 length:351 start_codon:yes stop_codon:yes gene_type:complete